MTTPVTFTFEGVSVEFSALELGLGGLTELAQTDATTVEVAETAQGLLTFISTSRANFHNSSDLQQELSRLAQDPKIARVLMQALHLIHQGNWHPTTKRFAEHVDPSAIFANRKSSTQPSEVSAVGGQNLPRRVGNVPVYAQAEKSSAGILMSGNAVEIQSDVQQTFAFQKIVGALLGGAVGDALGYPHEFRPFRIFTRALGFQVRDFVPFEDRLPGAISDDTQWTQLMAEALIETEGGFRGDFMEVLSKKAVGWYLSPDNNRAPGRSCMEACGRLNTGTSWHDSGTPNSKGNGAIMRLAPIAIVYAHHPELLDQMASDSAWMTHQHPTAKAGAVITARIIAFALESTDPLEFKRRVIEKVTQNLPEGSGEILKKLKMVPQLLQGKPLTAFLKIGLHDVCEETLAAALYAVLSTNSYEEAVLRAANIPGDSDTVAAIAGNIAGALYGAHAIPRKWGNNVEQSHALSLLGLSLAMLQTQLPALVAKKKENDIVHNHPFVRYPEFERAMQNPNAALSFFQALLGKVLESTGRFDGNDSWIAYGPGIDGKIAMTRQERDAVVQQHPALFHQMVTTDVFTDLSRLQRRLLKDTRLSLSSRIALGVSLGPLVVRAVRHDLLSELSPWMLANDIKSPVENAPISDEAIRRLEAIILRKFPEWHSMLQTREWAGPIIRQSFSEWMVYLENLDPIPEEHMPKRWRKDYRTVMDNFTGLLQLYPRNSGSVPAVLTEWFIVQHARFVRNRQK